MGSAFSFLKKNKKPKEGEEESQEELAYKAYLADKTSTRLIVNGSKIKSIDHPLLNLIFKQDFSTFERAIQKLESEVSKKDFEWNLSLWFWFAVHLKHLDFVKFLVDFNINLKKVVHFSRRIGTKNSSIGGDDLSQDREDSKEKNNHTNVNLLGNRNFNKDEQVPVRLNQEKERSLEEDSDEEDWKQEGGEDDSEDVENYDENYDNSPQKHIVERNQNNAVLQDSNMMAMKTNSSKKSKLTESSKQRKYDTEESQKRNSKYGNMLVDEDEKKDEVNEIKSIKEKEKSLSKSFSSKSISVKGNQRNQSEQSVKLLQTDPFFGRVVNMADIENIILDDEDSLERVRFFLQNQAQVFIKNVLVILVKENEEELAWVLCQYYQWNPPIDLIEKILSKNYWVLLKYIWKYDRRPYEEVDDINSEKYDFSDLIQLFKDSTKSEIEYESYLHRLCKWNLKWKDNFLKGLLYHNHDSLALQLMGEYFHEMNQELLIFWLDKGKEAFLNKSLYAFNKFIFRQDNVVEKLLELLKNGSQLNNYLNILTLVDISIWKINQIKALINIFEGYAYHEYETNQLLLSYNPLMTIALTWEILTHISNNK